MLKRFFIILIGFITIFLPESQAWSAVNNSDKIVQSINISIDKSTFLINDSSPAVIAKREQTIESVNSNSGSTAWAASIFISGLGQILMGDFWRGFKFTLLVYGLSILSGPIAYFITSALIQSRNNFSVSSVGFGPVILPFVLVYLAISLSVLAIHIWNIFDAYNMSREIKANETDSEELSKLQDKLQTAINTLNKINNNDNSNISINVLCF